MARPDNSIGTPQAIGIILLFVLFIPFTSFAYRYPKFLGVIVFIVWLALLYRLIYSSLNHEAGTYEDNAAIPIIRTGLSPDLSVKLSDGQLKTFIEVRDTNLKKVTRNMFIGPRLFDAKLLVPLLAQHGIILSPKEIDQVNDAEMPYLKQIGAA